MRSYVEVRTRLTERGSSWLSRLHSYALLDLALDGSTAHDGSVGIRFVRRVPWIGC